MKNTVFLSGACRNISEEERNSWRAWFESKSRKEMMGHKFEIFNPNKKFCYENDGTANEKVVMDYFLNRLDNSNIVVVNLKATLASVGTGMEISRAKCMGKYIIGFNQCDTTYEYLADCCNVILDTKEDVWDFLVTYF